MRHPPSKNKALAFGKAQEITAVALLTALCVAGRWLFSSLPNIQPMTAMILLVVQGMGMVYGMAVATLSIFISNLLLGFGPWTVAQIAAYLVVCAVFRLSLIPFSGKASVVFRAVMAGILGFVYGLIVSFNALAFLPLRSLPLYYISGLSFDALHAASNTIFYILLFRPFLRVMRRFWGPPPYDKEAIPHEV